MNSIFKSGSAIAVIVLFASPLFAMQNVPSVGMPKVVAALRAKQAFTPTNQLFLELKQDSKEHALQQADICSVILHDHYKSHKEKVLETQALIKEWSVDESAQATTSLTKSYAPLCHDVLKYVHVTTHSCPLEKIVSIAIENKSSGKTTIIPQKRADIFITLFTKIRKDAKSSEKYSTISCISEKGKTLEVFAGLKDAETDCTIEYPEDAQITFSETSE